MRKLFGSLLCLFCFVLSTVAQEKTITGKVSDQNGQPIAGASVQVKGTSIGTITNSEGTYTLKVPANSQTIIISYAGLGTQELAIGSNETLNVTLTESAKDMDEVVVVAYGTAKKSTFTGSSAQVSAKQIEQRPLTNLNNALAGAVPGVQTNAGSGQPGAGPAIRVRGFGSISASSDPLYVVDGVPYSGNIENLNPDDVESISVLKDASATALYGNRAANGVIMVTTKKGRKGRHQMSINVSQGVISRGIPEYDRVDAFQYYPLQWEARRNALVYGATPVPIGTANTMATNEIKGLLGYNPFNVANNDIVRTDGTLNPNAQLLWGDDLNWNSELQRKGTRGDYSVAFSGGSDKNDYYVSLGYINEKGFVIKSDYKRYNARLNFNMQPTTWFKAGVNLGGTIANSNTADVGSNTGYVNPFFFTRNMGPIYPVYAHNQTTGAYILDAQGNRIYDLGGMTALGLPARGPGASTGRHIVAETKWDENLYQRNAISARTYGEIKFLKDFKFTTNVGVDLRNYLESGYDNKVVGDGAPAGRARKSNSITNEYTINQLLNYNKTFSDHNVDVLVGHENYNWEQNSLSGSVSNQVVEGNTELVNFTSANGLPYSELNRYRIESFFSRANYTYDNKYMVSGSLRRDGSSKFYEDTRWGTFWSVGAGWVVSQESFMQDVSFLNFLKLRSSLGTVGNDNLSGYYLWQSLYTLGYNNAGEPGFIQGSLPSKELHWETNKQFDLGLEFGMFKDRITGTFEYFNRISEDLLFSVPLPLSSGSISVPKNVGTMYNKGFEFQVSANVIQKKDFVWNINLNATTFKNEITRMPEESPKITSSPRQMEVGSSIYEYWLRDYYGVDPTDGAALYYANTYNASNSRIIGKDTFTTSANNAKFHYAGTAIPDLIGGVTNTFTYKNWDLSFLITYQIGGLVYDDSYAALMNSDYGGALHIDALQRWTKAGDVTIVPRMDNAKRADFGAVSDRWLIDASYFAVRTLNIGYNLPKAYAQRIRVQNARFYVSGENLYLQSKRKGMNPVQSFSGVTNNAYTPARIITAGLNITL